MIRKGLLTVLVGTGFISCSSTVASHDRENHDAAVRHSQGLNSESEVGNLDSAHLDSSASHTGVSGQTSAGQARGWWGRLFSSRSSESYSASGSLVLSFQLPSRGEQEIACNYPQNDKSFSDFTSPNHKPRFAPLLGYFPPKLSKLPAANEVWLEIDRKEARLKVFQGKQLLEETAIEGASKIPSGDYLVQSKQSSPRWYAGDEYFNSRGLPVPEKMAESRFLKGALGPKALFLSDNLAIHSSSIWSDEVGGIKVDRSVLGKIYERSPIGVSVIVR